MVWRTTSTSVSPIIAHCFMIHFLKLQMVVSKASFMSSWTNSERWLKIPFILSTYFWASSGFCAPVSGHSSSSSSSKSITGGVSFEAIMLIKMFWIPDLRKGPTRLSSSKTRYRMLVLVGTAAYIGSMTLICLLPPG